MLDKARLLLPILCFSCVWFPQMPEVSEVSDASTSGSDAGDAVDAGVDAGAPDARAMGRILARGLVGLWSGPATQTPLGNVPRMNVELAAVGNDFLFGRVDLDHGNSLRFGFGLFQVGGSEVLGYRNGGYFQGALRDMLATLVEADINGRHFRFCHATQGCGYINARFNFIDDDHLLLDVHVRGKQHLLWKASRVTHRSIFDALFRSPLSLGDGTAPWPDMPSADVTVQWSEPLPGKSDLWVLLQSKPCGVAGACQVVRTLKMEAAAGATQGVLHVDQLHAGTYFVRVLVDANRNFGTLLTPDTGDKTSWQEPPLSVLSGNATLTVGAAVTVP